VLDQEIGQHAELETDGGAVGPSARSICAIAARARASAGSTSPSPASNSAIVSSSTLALSDPSHERGGRSLACGEVLQRGRVLPLPREHVPQGQREWATSG